MKEVIRTIKYAYQRMRYGVDETFQWGADSYLNYYFVPQIKKFCQNELKDTELMKLNPQKKEVFEKTLELAKKLENMPIENYYKEPNEETDFWSYFGKNITVYWN